MLNRILGLKIANLHQSVRQERVKLFVFKCLAVRSFAGFGEAETDIWESFGGRELCLKAAAAELL